MLETKLNDKDIRDTAETAVDTIISLPKRIASYDTISQTFKVNLDEGWLLEQSLSRLAGLIIALHVLGLSNLWNFKDDKNGYKLLNEMSKVDTCFKNLGGIPTYRDCLPNEVIAGMNRNAK